MDANRKNYTDDFNVMNEEELKRLSNNNMDYDEHLFTQQQQQQQQQIDTGSAVDLNPEYDIEDDGEIDSPVDGGEEGSSEGEGAREEGQAPRRPCSQYLGTKGEMVYSLLSILGSNDKGGMSRTLLDMSRLPDSCDTMRQSGCISLLVHLIHGADECTVTSLLQTDERTDSDIQTDFHSDMDTRLRARSALYNIVKAYPAERSGRQEIRILRLLEQIRAYCDQLRAALYRWRFPTHRNNTAANAPSQPFHSNYGNYQHGNYQHDHGNYPNDHGHYPHDDGHYPHDDVNYPHGDYPHGDYPHDMEFSVNYVEQYTTSGVDELPPANFTGELPENQNFNTECISELQQGVCSDYFSPSNERQDEKDCSSATDILPDSERDLSSAQIPENSSFPAQGWLPTYDYPPPPEDWQLDCGTAPANELSSLVWCPVHHSSSTAELDSSCHSCLCAVMTGECGSELDFLFPGQAVSGIMKHSFDGDHRHAVCKLGGVECISELLHLHHVTSGCGLIHGDVTDHLTMRRYACMTLTNLTFGDGANKSLICSRVFTLQALVAQVSSRDDDLCQVSASVIRNLSWRADSSSKKALKQTGCVTVLTNAAICARRESTLKSVLSALWNLSSHSAENKAEFCAVDGALELLVGLLDYRSPSNTLAIVENGSGILRNVSSHIAICPEYRSVIRELGCLQLLLKHLRSSSLTIVSNACGALWNLSAHCLQDQRLLWDLGAVSMLRNLINSRHRMISMGSAAALKNLLAAAESGQMGPGCSIFSPDVTFGIPGLQLRKRRALEEELKERGSQLSEMCDNVEHCSRSPSSSPPVNLYLPRRMTHSLRSLGGSRSVERVEAMYKSEGHVTRRRARPERSCDRYFVPGIPNARDMGRMQGDEMENPGEFLHQENGLDYDDASLSYLHTECNADNINLYDAGMIDTGNRFIKEGSAKNRNHNHMKGLSDSEFNLAREGERLFIDMDRLSSASSNDGETSDALCGRGCQENASHQNNASACTQENYDVYQKNSSQNSTNQNQKFSTSSNDSNESAENVVNQFDLLNEPNQNGYRNKSSNESNLLPLKINSSISRESLKTKLPDVCSTGSNLEHVPGPSGTRNEVQMCSGNVENGVQLRNSSTRAINATSQAANENISSQGRNFTNIPLITSVSILDNGRPISIMSGFSDECEIGDIHDIVGSDEGLDNLENVLYEQNSDELNFNVLNQSKQIFASENSEKPFAGKSRSTEMDLVDGCGSLRRDASGSSNPGYFSDVLSTMNIPVSNSSSNELIELYDDTIESRAACSKIEPIRNDNFDENDLEDDYSVVEKFPETLQRYSPDGCHEPENIFIKSNPGTHTVPSYNNQTTDEGDFPFMMDLLAQESQAILENMAAMNDESAENSQSSCLREKRSDVIDITASRKACNTRSGLSSGSMCDIMDESFPDSFIGSPSVLFSDTERCLSHDEKAEILSKNNTNIKPQCEVFETSHVDKIENKDSLNKNNTKSIDSLEALLEENAKIVLSEINFLQANSENSNTTENSAESYTVNSLTNQEPDKINNKDNLANRNVRDIEEPILSDDVSNHKQLNEDDDQNDDDDDNDDDVHMDAFSTVSAGTYCVDDHRSDDGSESPIQEKAVVRAKIVKPSEKNQKPSQEEKPVGIRGKRKPLYPGKAARSGDAKATKVIAAAQKANNMRLTEAVKEQGDKVVTKPKQASNKILTNISDSKVIGKSMPSLVANRSKLSQVTNSKGEKKPNNQRVNSLDRQDGEDNDKQKTIVKQNTFVMDATSAAADNNGSSLHDDKTKAEIQKPKQSLKSGNISSAISAAISRNRVRQQTTSTSSSNLPEQKVTKTSSTPGYPEKDVAQIKSQKPAGKDTNVIQAENHPAIKRKNSAGPATGRGRADGKGSDSVTTERKNSETKSVASTPSAEVKLRLGVSHSASTGDQIGSASSGKRASVESRAQSMRRVGSATLSGCDTVVQKFGSSRSISSAASSSDLTGGRQVEVRKKPTVAEILRGEKYRRSSPASLTSEKRSSVTGTRTRSVGSAGASGSVIIAQRAPSAGATRVLPTVKETTVKKSPNVKSTVSDTQSNIASRSGSSPAAGNNSKVESANCGTKTGLASAGRPSELTMKSSPVGKISAVKSGIAKSTGLKNSPSTTASPIQTPSESSPENKTENSKPPLKSKPLPNRKPISWRPSDPILKAKESAQATKEPAVKQQRSAASCKAPAADHVINSCAAEDTAGKRKPSSVQVEEQEQINQKVRGTSDCSSLSEDSLNVVAQAVPDVVDGTATVHPPLVRSSTYDRLNTMDNGESNGTEEVTRNAAVRDQNTKTTKQSVRNHAVAAEKRSKHISSEAHPIESVKAQECPLEDKKLSHIVSGLVKNLNNISPKRGLPSVPSTKLQSKASNGSADIKSRDTRSAGCKELKQAAREFAIDMDETEFEISLEKSQAAHDELMARYRKNINSEESGECTANAETNQITLKNSSKIPSQKFSSARAHLENSLNLHTPSDNDASATPETVTEEQQNKFTDDAKKKRFGLKKFYSKPKNTTTSAPEDQSKVNIKNETDILSAPKRTLSSSEQNETYLNGANGKSQENTAVSFAKNEDKCDIVIMEDTEEPLCDPIGKDIKQISSKQKVINWFKRTDSSSVPNKTFSKTTGIQRFNDPKKHSVLKNDKVYSAESQGFSAEQNKQISQQKRRHVQLQQLASSSCDPPGNKQLAQQSGAATKTEMLLSRLKRPSGDDTQPWRNRTTSGGDSGTASGNGLKENNSYVREEIPSSLGTVTTV